MALLVTSVTTSAQNSDDYFLDSGDKIGIRVHGEEDLSFETKIGVEGTILYPFLGELEVANKTTAGVRRLIKEGLKGDYLDEPNVDVAIIEYRPFFILGQVNRPKDYPFQPGLTVSQAIAIGGGFTERASKKGIELKRVKHGTVSLLNDVDMDERVYPGDVITISESFF